MKQKLITICIIFAGISSFAQTDTTDSAGDKKQVPSLAVIHTTDGKKIKGWFYKTDEDSIYLLPQVNKKALLLNLKNRTFINNGFAAEVSQISSISLQKKNAGLKGTLIGFGAGVFIGVVGGFISGDDPIMPCSPNDFFCLGAALNNAFALTAEEKALVGGIRLGLTGALTGFIIGKLVKKKFIIGGKKEVYRDLQAELTKRLLLK
jgi:hypothetical protein